MTRVIDDKAEPAAFRIIALPVTVTIHKSEATDKYIIALGADGFGAVFSLPAFDTGRSIVADKLNGQPLSVSDGPLQVISPDEARRSRWIKLSRITVRKALP